MIRKFAILFVLLFPIISSADALSGALQGAASAMSDIADRELNRLQQLELMQKQHELEMQRIQRMEEMQIRAEQRRASERYDYQPQPAIQQRIPTGSYCFQLSDGTHCY